MRINRIPGVKFTSNIYQTSNDPYHEKTYLIDAGCLQEFQNNNLWPKDISGVFLTHAHYDHIFDLPILIEKYPKLMVYLSIESYEYLKDSKLNLSRYHESDIEIELLNYHILDEGDQIELFGGIFIEVYRTPGHSNDCLTYKVLNNFFTGDALIPGVAVVTKLRFGNKEKVQQSLNRLKDIMRPNSVIWPGHLQPKVMSDINWSQLV